MASKLVQLKSKAAETSKFVAKHGCAYYKQMMEENKHYVQHSPSIAMVELTVQEVEERRNLICDVPYQLSPSELVSLKSPSNYCDILSYIGKYSGEQKELLNKFVNFRMKEGKRRKVRAIFDRSFHLSAQSEGDVIELLVKAVENIKPICEVERVKKSGTTHNVPSIVGKARQQSLAIRWILEGAEERRTSKNTNLAKSTFEEIVDAYQQRGTAHMKKKNLHRLASEVRTFQNKKRR